MNYNTWLNKSTILIFLIILLGIGLRLYCIGNPLLDHHDHRQACDAMAARNFYRHSFNIFYPEMDSDGKNPLYVGDAFPLYPYLVSFLYLIFGIHEILGRLLGFPFYVGSVIILFFLTKKFCNIKTAYFSVLIFTLSPLSIYYSRTFHRPMVYVFLCLATLYYFSEWLDKEKKRDYYFCAISGSFMLLIYFPMACIGLPMLYLAYQKFKYTLFKQKYLWLLVVIYFLPTLIWYYRATYWMFDNISVSAIVAKEGYSQLSYYLLWLKPVFWRTVLTNLAGFTLTPIGIILFLFGMFLIIPKSARYFLYLWLLSILIYFALYPYVIYLHVHDYTYIPILPVTAIFAGKTLSFICDRKWSIRYIGLMVSFILLVMIGIIGFKSILPWYEYNETLYLTGKQVERLTPQDSLVVTIQNSGNTNFLYYSNRRGWRINLQLVEPEKIEEFREQGATYFVAFYPRDLKQKILLRDYLFTNYEPIRYSLYYTLFRIDKKVEKPTCIVTTPPISHPINVKFENDFILLGYDLEKEKVLPGESCVVTYYWKTLKPHQTPADFFVNVELQTKNQPVLENRGQKLFYRLWGHGASYSPVSGKWLSPFVYRIANPASWVVNYLKPIYPSNRWQPGEIIKLSYEIFIPKDAPVGIYQIRPGVNALGKNMKIEPVTMGDNENRVVGAQVEVIRHPEFVYKSINKLDEMQQDLLSRNDLFELSEVINNTLFLESFSQDNVAKIKQRYNSLLTQYGNRQGFAMDSAVSFIGYSLKQLGKDRYKLYFMFRANERFDKDWMLYVHGKVADKDVPLLSVDRQQYKFENWGFMPEPPTSQWQKQQYVIISREFFTKLPRVDLEIGWSCAGEGRYGKSVHLGWIDLSPLEEGFHDYSDILSSMISKSTLFDLYELKKDTSFTESLSQELVAKVDQQYNALLNQYVSIHESEVNYALTFMGYSVKKFTPEKYKVYFVFRINEQIDKDWIIYIHAKVADKDVPLLPAARQPYKYDGWDFKPEPPTSKWQKQGVMVISREIVAKPIPYDIELGFYRIGEMRKSIHFGIPIKLGWVDFQKIE